MPKNPKILSLSQQSLEPMIVNTLNNLYGDVLIAKKSTLFEDRVNKADMWLQVKTECLQMTTNRLYKVDVKTIENKNNKGIYTNFSLTKDCFNSHNHCDFFIFAYPKNNCVFECYLCSYDDVVKSGKVKNIKNFYLFPLLEIKNTYLKKFEIAI